MKKAEELYPCVYNHICAAIHGNSKIPNRKKADGKELKAFSLPQKNKTFRQ